MPILAPVRYPLDDRSRGTLERAVAIAGERDDELVVLHVDLFQDSKDVSRTALANAVDELVADVPTTYVVRQGFLVERSILEEAANQGVDTIVIGRTGVGRLRRTMRRLIGNDPDIEGFLRENLDVEIEVAE